MNLPARAALTFLRIYFGVILLVAGVPKHAAAGGLLLMLNYMFAKGNWAWYPSSNDAAFAAISVALLVGAAGRTLGLDAFLAERWPRSPLW